MTARTTRPSRRKKAAQPTAHVGYQPADPAARRRDRYHAVADQPVTLGQLVRDPGQALCGLKGPWPDSPAGLFPPLVSCLTCRALAAAGQVVIADGS
jgi:hypothetical protein